MNNRESSFRDSRLLLIQKYIPEEILIRVMAPSATDKEVPDVQLWRDEKLLVLLGLLGTWRWPEIGFKDALWGHPSLLSVALSRGKRTQRYYSQIAGQNHYILLLPYQAAEVVVRSLGHTE